MNQKIAIAAIHGIGLAAPEWQDGTSSKFISGMSKPLISKFARYGYWKDDEVIEPIAKALVETWEAVN
jgi:hypothetical protein